MSSQGAIWGPATLRLLRVVAAKTAKAVRTRLAEAALPAPCRIRPAFIPIKRQPFHPAALLKQKNHAARWFSGAANKNIDAVLRRLFARERPASSELSRSKLSLSNTLQRITQFSGRAPFATGLRPNLTGGALPRSAGGYSLGGSARYFSHAPATPAQVVQNVSQAMRAFFLSGQRFKFDGVGPHGHAKYRAVPTVEDTAMRRLANAARSAPGAFIDFDLNLTVTAFRPHSAIDSSAREASTSGSESHVVSTTLHAEGLLDYLSADLSRAHQELKAVNADLRRLSVLGDLPIDAVRRVFLRVRFPGVDSWAVERLCDDLGIQRGIVGQDGDFETSVGAPGILKMPFAPDARGGLALPGVSSRSTEGHEFDTISSLRDDDSLVREAFAAEMERDPWLSEPDGHRSTTAPVSSGGLEGIEGIYRFLEECDRGKGRLG